LLAVLEGEVGSEEAEEDRLFDLMMKPTKLEPGIPLLAFLFAYARTEFLHTLKITRASIKRQIKEVIATDFRSLADVVQQLELLERWAHKGGTDYAAHVMGAWKIIALAYATGFPEERLIAAMSDILNEKVEALGSYEQNLEALSCRNLLNEVRRRM
jgi:hypothetical protein